MADFLDFDVLHNFISPVTGRVLATTNYVLVGDALGIATPSPILIDIRLDLNALKKRYNTLVTADFIVGHANYEIPDAQVLFDLADGFMFNTAGIVSTLGTIPITALPDLLKDNIWIGNASNRPTEQQRVALLNLPSFLSADIPSNKGLYNLYTGKVLSLTGSSDAAVPTTTMRIDMSNTPNVSEGKMLIGVRNATPPVITIDGTAPYVHITGSLNWDAMNGVLNEIGLDPGEIFIGSDDPLKVGQIVTTTTIPITVLTDLTFHRIWRGDVTNRPVESDDLTTAETNITNLQTDVGIIQGDIITINGEIAVINGEITVLQGQVGVIEATLYTPIIGLVDVVAGLVVTVAAHTVSIASLFTLSARTLDQIPLAAADVDLNNHKIVNLSNPTNPLDAVNLQTLTAAIGGAGTVTSVTGTANQITVINNTTTPVVSLPAAVQIVTSLAVANLTLSGNTLASISNNNVIISPNGTGQVDVNTHRILNVSNPVGVLDAVNLQTLTAAIATAGTVTSVTGTANQITVVNSTTTPVISLPTAVQITTSLAVANLTMATNVLGSISNNNVAITPNGTGQIDATNHKIINLSNPSGSLDAVNLQTLNTAIAGAGTVTSVTGTTNQITVVNNTTTPVISLPSAVVITTSLAVANLTMSSSTIASVSNNDITIAPNGTGNLILNQSGNASFAVGIRGTPSSALDVFGTTRTTRIIGNADPSTAAGQGQPPTVTLGAAGVVGTGATSSVTGTLIGGNFTLNTGTGVLAAGLLGTFNLVTAMPFAATSFAVVVSACTATPGRVFAKATSASQFTLTLDGTIGLTASTTYSWNYVIIGYS